MGAPIADAYAQGALVNPKPTAAVELVLDSMRQQGDELHLNLVYPTLGGNINKLVVGLEHVRAADDIRISYDFERDGWKVEQASKFAWGPDDTTNCDPDWQEVAFVQAWGRERPSELLPDA